MTPSAAERGGISARGLSRHYGSVRALDGIDFDVAPGTIIGLLGPNGAGKTTALRIFAALLEPTAGEVTVAGHDPQRDPLAVRRSTGFLTGDTGLYERLTPPELLRYFGDLHGLPRPRIQRRIEALTEQLELGAFSSRRCGTLSTGQRQRVSVARALLHEPPVLIFDEPTSGLDVLAAQFVLHALMRERDRGAAVVFCSHILEEAELICDEVAFIHRGHIVERDPVGTIRERHRASSLTSAFLSAIAEADPEAAAAIAGHPHAAGPEPS